MRKQFWQLSIYVLVIKSQIVWIKWVSVSTTQHKFITTSFLPIQFIGIEQQRNKVWIYT